MTALRTFEDAPCLRRSDIVPCGRRALVTGVGGPAGRAAARALADARYSVVGSDMRVVPFAEGVLVPSLPVADRRYAVDLSATLAEHAIDWLVPTVAEEIAAVAMIADDLRAAGIAVFVPDASAAAICADKWLTARRLRALGIASPRSAIGMAGAADIAALGLPVLAKPRIGRGGRGVVVYDETPDLDASDMRLWQQFLSGTEYVVALFPDPRGGASPLALVTLEKLALREGRTGNALAVRRVAVDDVAELAVAAATALALKGPLDIDIRRDAAGAPHVLEINPRVGAGLLDAPEIVTAMIALQQGGWPG